MGVGLAVTAREAVARGHQVISWRRNVPADPIESVRYVTGRAADAVAIIPAADAVVLALSRGQTAGRLCVLLGVRYGPRTPNRTPTQSDRSPRATTLTTAPPTRAGPGGPNIGSVVS